MTHRAERASDRPTGGAPPPMPPATRRHVATRLATPRERRRASAAARCPRVRPLAPAAVAAAPRRRAVRSRPRPALYKASCVACPRLWRADTTVTAVKSSTAGCVGWAFYRSCLAGRHAHLAYTAQARRRPFFNRAARLLAWSLDG